MCIGMLQCALLDDLLFAVDDVEAGGQGERPLRARTKCHH